ncbi:MAG: CBS domain-containing protein [Acetobacteraceae bacterium]|nr:CBS domain-containing protein [Acetobacteraceae bacterium]
MHAAPASQDEYDGPDLSDAEEVTHAAYEIMTKDVVKVSPDTRAPEIARRLLERRISAAPVVAESGRVVGMFSEGDLIGRDEAAHGQRRDWWLWMIAAGEDPSVLARVRRPELTAREIMSAPVVCVTEYADDREIARLLSVHRIKRVPVVRVGIVSRADLHALWRPRNDKTGQFRPAIAFR